MARPDDRYDDRDEDRYSDRPGRRDSGDDDYDRPSRRRRDDDFDYEPRSRFRKQDVPNYLVPAVLVTLLCCPLAGIPSIVYAVQANNKAQAGDYEAAIQAANTAKIWMWVSFVLGILSLPLQIWLTIVSESGQF